MLEGGDIYMEKFAEAVAGPAANQRAQQAIDREDLLCSSHRRGGPLFFCAHAPPMAKEWIRWATRV